MNFLVIMCISYGAYRHGLYSLGRCSHGLYTSQLVMAHTVFGVCSYGQRAGNLATPSIVMAHIVLARVAMACAVMVRVVLAYAVMANGQRPSPPDDGLRLFPLARRRLARASQLALGLVPDTAREEEPAALCILQ